MNNFDEFLNKLLDNPSLGMVISVKGKRHFLKAMAQYYSKNYPDIEYIKIIFTDGAFMLIIISEEEIYYANQFLEVANGISDEMIGNDRLVFNGKEYRLVNKDDYQFVRQLYVGSNLEIEGECRFSDYFPIEKGKKEFFSLGWLSYNGKRADLWSELVDVHVIVVE